MTREAEEGDGHKLSRTVKLSVVRHRYKKWLPQQHCINSHRSVFIANTVFTVSRESIQQPNMLTVKSNIHTPCPSVSYVYLISFTRPGSAWSDFSVSLVNIRKERGGGTMKAKATSFKGLRMEKNAFQVKDNDVPFPCLVAALSESWRSFCRTVSVLLWTVSVCPKRKKKKKHTKRRREIRQPFSKCTQIPYTVNRRKYFDSWFSVA